MSRKRTIRVKRVHIYNGVPRNPEFCPVAKALDEQLGGTWQVRSEVAVDLDDVNRTIILPGFVRRFVERFDEDDEVMKPIHFTVYV